MPNEKLKSYPLYRLTQKYIRQKHRRNTVFLLPKTYNFIHNHRLVRIPCVIFERLRKAILPDFRPENDRNKAVSIFPVVFCFQAERRIDMPRMSKKRKQEWALFLNERNRITYNELCRKCSNDCKQSFRCIVVHCPKYLSKRRTKNNDENG